MAGVRRAQVRALGKDEASPTPSHGSRTLTFEYDTRVEVELKDPANDA